MNVKEDGICSNYQLPTMTDKRQTRPLVREGAPHGQAVTFKQEEISGRVPQPGLDDKTDRLTDRQSQCDFDFDFETQFS
jgi:hypothetical protein